MKIGPLFPSFLDSFIPLMTFIGCKPYTLSSSFFFFVHFVFPLFLSEESSRVANCSGVYPVYEISTEDFRFQKFSPSSESPFLIFRSFQLVWWCLLPIYTCACNFPFFQAFWFILISQFYIFRYLSFSTFNYEHDTFSGPNFILILSLNILNVSIRVSFFSFSANCLMSIFIRWLIFLGDFLDL